MLRNCPAPLPTRPAHARRPVLTCGAAGFGGKAVTPATVVLPGFDGDGDEHFLLARAGPDGRWLPLGDVVLAAGADVATALCQRYVELKKFALKRHVSLAARKPGVALEIGYRLQKGTPTGDSEAEVLIVAETTTTAEVVPATLHLLEADTKPVSRESLLAPRGPAAAPGGFTSKALRSK